MNDSRSQILNSLRHRLPQSAPLPTMDESWIQFPDPIAQFRTAVVAVGGQTETCKAADLADTVGRLTVFDESKRIVSTVDGIAGNVDLQQVADPHDLEDVHLAIALGQFGVAENGAVWIDDHSLRHRVVLFIPQHVILVIPSRDVVHNMHEAYRRIDFAENHFGVFISGPSKTADIEQSLVIGAHGARSMHVVLVD
ncbi:MAG: LUD domain-containing protein [Pirellulaceae bacterium]